MALVKCHECGNQVSTEAKNCPQCGAKVKRPTSRTTIVLGGLFAVAVAAAVVQTGGGKDESTVFYFRCHGWI